MQQVLFTIYCPILPPHGSSRISAPEEATSCLPADLTRAGALLPFIAIYP